MKNAMKLFLGIVLGFYSVATVGIYFRSGSERDAEITKDYLFLKDIAWQIDQLNFHFHSRIYRNCIDALELVHGNLPQNQWPEKEKEDYERFKAKLSELENRYKFLAKTYDFIMAKNDFSFMNIHYLPQGMKETLPRQAFMCESAIVRLMTKGDKGELEKWGLLQYVR